MDEHGPKMSQMGGGSHQYLWRLIVPSISSRQNRQVEREVSRKFKDLKTFREESDYHEIEIDYAKSDKAYKTAQDIRIILQRTFYS